MLSCCRGQRHRSLFIKKLKLESFPYKIFDLKNINKSWIKSDPNMTQLYNEDEKMKFDFILNDYIIYINYKLYIFFLFIYSKGEIE